MGAGVDVEPTVAEESDEGLAAFVGELDGETGRGGDGGDDGDTGGECLLHDFEGDTSGDEQDVGFQGQMTGDGHVPNDLVDRVVTSDVLAEDAERAVDGEQGGGMDPAGAVEGGLGGAHGFGQGEQPGGIDGGWVVDGGVGLADGVDGSLAAQAAGRDGEDVTGEAGEVDGEIGPQLDVEDRAMGIARVGKESGDVGAGLDDGFGEEESGGQFGVVSGGAEGDGDGAGIDADFEGFLGGDGIEVLGPAAAGMELVDGNGRGGRGDGIRGGLGIRGVDHGEGSRRWDGG